MGIAGTLAAPPHRVNAFAALGGADDPLNRGWMILGGGEECRDLYTGSFQTARVLAEQWYNTNLKAIIVGDTPPLSVHQQPPHGYPSNSIVDSGTTSIDLGPLLLKALFAHFTPDQQALLTATIRRHQRRSMQTRSNGER